MAHGRANLSASDTLANRFCYWQGSAGERYLFSQISLNELSSFTECVLLLTLEEEKSEPQIHWIGDISDLSPRAFSNLTACDFVNLNAYVHLLSGSQQARQRIISELSHKADKEACSLTA